MAFDSSFIVLALHHGWVFRIVVAVLVAASLASWTVIFQKRMALTTARKRLPVLEALVARDGGRSVTIVHPDFARAGLARVLAVGWDRIASVTARGTIDGELVREYARYAWEGQLSRELRRLSQNLPFLATVGSVSPYLGLFGTVLGVIDALTGLGVQSHVDLSSVAPGIAEALLATAVGLFAAIPAVVAHNLFAARIEELSEVWLTIVGEAELWLVSDTHPAGTVQPPDHPAHDGRNDPISDATSAIQTSI